MGGGRGDVVLVEPLADATVHADVEAGALGFEPLVLEDFVELVQPVSLMNRWPGGRLQVLQRKPERLPTGEEL